MAPRKSDPFNIWRSSAELSALAFETHAVVTMRMMGMAGIWPVEKSENDRMMSEKQPAFAKAASAATTVAMQGGRMDEVFSAATKSLTTKARANRKRLSKRVLP
ncbi:hypothetical protein IMCC20628_02899 [Hoeflea sp. IMCC20628]|uniref:hypothetical protein n=1 Tax=Hoeflea sp. IMCC20628 TaxID=1620421 RepID=UPI00063ADCC0|nr:hypothetical protein [Hoeflea sp. IMCC20628]AKI01594.1 hypothetical protein IMCC20628_02899 [Hoeflea sp. IMCC20628]